MSSRTRVEQTTSAINFRWMKETDGDRALRQQVALSVAVIADALSWQVEQEIRDRSLKAMGDTT